MKPAKSTARRSRGRARKPVLAMELSRGDGTARQRAGIRLAGCPLGGRASGGIEALDLAGLHRLWTVACCVMVTASDLGHRGDRGRDPREPIPNQLKAGEKGAARQGCRARRAGPNRAGSGAKSFPAGPASGLPNGNREGRLAVQAGRLWARGGFGAMSHIARCGSWRRGDRADDQLRPVLLGPEALQQFVGAWARKAITASYRAMWVPRRSRSRSCSGERRCTVIAWHWAPISTAAKGRPSSGGVDGTEAELGGVLGGGYSQCSALTMSVCLTLSHPPTHL
jgi:hypothetical protein